MLSPEPVQEVIIALGPTVTTFTIKLSLNRK